MLKRKMPAARTFAPHAQRDGGIGTLIEQIKRNQAAPAIGPGEQGQARSYSQIAPVYACVRAKADALGMLPLMTSTADDLIVETGPLAELAERPNEKMTGRQFRRFTSAFLDLFGRVHWWLHLDAGGRPLEVFPINPLLMKPKTDRRNGELIAWEYRPGGRYSGHVEILPLDEVWTIADPDFEDPSDPISGLSPRRTVAHAISQYHKADLANEASLNNGVEPSLVLEAQGGRPTEDQLRDMREELNEKYASYRNRRRPIVLYGVSVNPIPVSFTDMEFVELKQMSRTDICAAFSVPPAVIGYYEDSNYAHATAAEEAFWVKTILPRAAWLAEEWACGVLDRFGGDRSLAVADAQRRSCTVHEANSRGHRLAFKAGANRAPSGRRFYAWFDDSGVPAVQRARLAGVDTIVKWNAAGVPLNALIRAVDAPVEEVPWGDTWYKPFGLVDVQDEPGGGPGDDDPSGAEEETDLLGAAVPGRRDVPADEQRDERTRAQLWQQWRASWAALERGMRSKTRRHFHELRGQVLAAIGDNWPTAGKAITADRRRDLLGEIVFDLVAANGRLLSKVTPLLRDSYRLGGSQTMQEAADAKGVDEPEPFDLADPRVSQLLRRRQIDIGGLNRRLQANLRETLAAAIDEGKAINEVRDLIRQKFNVVEGRAATIARTEIGAAVEEGRSIAREQAGVPFKSWLSSRKETGRPSHMATEQMTMENPIRQADDFTIGTTGVTCPHPRASGDPAHDINCGCTTISRFADDKLREALARYVRRGFLTYEQLIERDGGGLGDRGRP